MSDLYSHHDLDFAVATLGRALRELLGTFTSAAPERDADGDEHVSWWLMLRPAVDDQEDAPAPAAAPTVTVCVDADSTRIEVTHPVGEEAYRLDDRSASAVERRPYYTVPMPAGSTGILTRW
ncbi:hypothetical protein AB0953_27880 [Streptomyces sp. NPDC046866]|uniref:hypothetical protein n=1 Tax=Streptomyces sp. NPDC046866 TaxID=3154921 RepID=UPI003456AFA6